MKSSPFLDQFLDEVVAERRAGWLAEGRAEGALEAKRDTVARWMRARLGQRAAAPLIARARGTSEPKLTRAMELLESKKDDAALLAALKKLLPARRSGPR